MTWRGPMWVLVLWAVSLSAENPKLWSLAALQSPKVPAAGDWGRTPVDGFVLAKLRVAKLQPQPPADRYTLIRRVTLALTGLPPTVAEIEQFIADTQPGAYGRLVDRLLASPRFGERWGRHWLDVVRFGESSGQLTVNADKPRANVWRFRDAVIRALNEDVPFDQFVRFHFAPDEKHKELGQFIQLGPRLQDNSNPNDKQFHRLDDMVATTGTAFLGISFGCARCHDHPVDPMTTEEYYQLTATFWDQVKEAPRASAKTIPLEIKEPRVLRRGSWSSPGAVVQPGFIKVLKRKEDTHWRTGKTELAALGDWLTDTEHGAGELLARVIVNRLWHHHFGQGLVRTPNDFGNLGTPPTHPQLLDYLARQLIEGGWRLKPIHRLIVTSATYRQSGTANTAPMKMDAGNTLLWHWRPNRLEAEAIRDSLLAVAGVLKPELYGPSISIGHARQTVRDEPKSWRRSIYLQAHRSAKHPTLSLFDPPDYTISVGARTTGATPNGALFALNAPLVWELAGHLAKRVQTEAGEEAKAQVKRLYLLALSRPPRPEELEIGLKLLGAENPDALRHYCHLVLGLNEMIYVN
ncbi:MAG: hypothetical protein CMO74_02325 [Verrucomicrobiales bacterium]|nr:hypothetical protein [Verrucomicrobiales bacterium]